MFSDCSRESRVVARKPRDGAAVLFGLKFADDIHCTSLREAKLRKPGFRAPVLQSILFRPPTPPLFHLILVIRVISFELTQHIRPRYINVINVTDGRTDEQTDGRLTIKYRALHYVRRAVKTPAHLKRIATLPCKILLLSNTKID